MADPIRFGSEFDMAVNTANFQSQSTLTRLPDGRVVVAWVDAGSNAGDIKYRLFSADGQPLSSELTANAGVAGSQGTPAITALTNGGFVIAWESFNADASGDVLFRRFNGAGNPLDVTDVPASANSSGYQQDPTLVGLSDGTFVVGWNEGNTAVSGLPSSSAAMIRSFGADGAALSGAIRVSGNFGGDFGPQLAAVDGALILVWDDDGGPSISQNGEDGIYSRTLIGSFPTANFTDGGVRIDEGVFRESSRNPGIDYDPVLGAVIVWDDDFSGSDDRDIYVNINGLGQTRVNTTTIGDQSNAQVVSLAYGGFVVVWQDSAGTAGDIRARVFTQEGDPTGNDFLVTSLGAATANAQTAPDVVALLDGRFMVSWSDEFAGGIQGMIFDPRMAAVSWVGTESGELFRGTDFAAPDVLAGMGGNDTIFGGAGADNLSGGDDNDTLDGEAGTDTLDGGAGNDTFVLGADSDSIVDVSGIDTIHSSISRNLAFYTAIENLTLTGTGNINGTGNALANRIVGNTGNNILNGGTDSVVDTLIGGVGNDTYLLGDGSDLVNDISGIDTIQSSISRNLGFYTAVEYLTLVGTGNINGTGNALANRIVGNTGNNILNGGTDSVVDTLIGGAGNDTYMLGAGSDAVNDTSGIDAIYSSISRNLGFYSAIEYLTLTETGNINGTGNALANRIVGNTGNNILNGGLGNDVLTGGAGLDSFVFTTALSASNIDLVTDYNVANDTIRVDNAVFAALGLGNLAVAAFAKNTTGLAGDASDRIIYESDTGKLFYDADGLGGAAGIHFATLTAGLALTQADFVVF